jgi:hypothetical protein
MVAPSTLPMCKYGVRVAIEMHSFFNKHGASTGSHECYPLSMDLPTFCRELCLLIASVAPVWCRESSVGY